MGNKLKMLREEKRMTQEELAKKSGISRQTIIAIENDKYSNVLLGTIAALADALETTVDNIFYPERLKD